MADSQPKSKALVVSKLSAPVLMRFEPVGRWFESRDSRLRVLSGSSSVGGEGVRGESSDDEGEEVHPLLLDPTQWKEQDHYVILGLGKLRYNATKEDIRKAYRQKVLTHHPDKQSADQQLEGDDHFKCIKIAYDVLSNPKRRRAFDSVDPTFDDSTPSLADVTKENFYSLLGPVFAENARWSTRQPVPLLGNEDASLEDVESFYAFWYDFESWREFSYLDEENTEKAECREEKRWMEKQNKAVRQKRKKEAMTRIRTLVDNAYSCDPRVKKFKEVQKAEKDAKKRAKKEAVRLEVLEREREQQMKLEEEKRLKEKEEEAAKAQAAQFKKEREAVKKALRKERKTFRAMCKSHDYFASGESEMVSKMENVERLCNSLQLERLQELNDRFAKLTVDDALIMFEQEITELNRQEQEKHEAAAQSKSSTQDSASSSQSKLSSDWTPEEVQLLVKAVTMYPAGTIKRWETIAGFVNSHSSDGCVEKTAKMVIAKVKTLKKVESSDKETQNKMAFARFEQQHVIKEKKKGAGVATEATPTEKYDGPLPWSAEEQKLLEQALRSYPASVSGRWDKITETVKSRTKEECIARFKELVARVKAKKQQTSS